MTTVNELVTAYKAQPSAVAAWLDEGDSEITRGAVKLLRAFLGEKFGQEEPSAGDGGGTGPAPQEAATLNAAAVETGPRRWRCGGVVVPKGGINAYQYAPNPTGWIDPLGLRKKNKKAPCPICSGTPCQGTKNPSRGASAFQSNKWYPNKDRWSNVILPKGTTVYTLYPYGPKPGGFFADGSTLAASKKSVSTYHDATQVGHSGNSKLFPRGPRQQVQAFTLKEDLCVGKAYALANDQYGPGGGAVLHHRKRSYEYGERTDYGFDKQMINLIEGQLELGAKKILTVSDYEDLNALAKEGLIEKREDPGKGEPYFYVESVEDGMRFGVIISLQEKKIEWFLLRWLDGPCTSKGWDGVSENALKDEYRLLLNFVEKMVGHPPDKKGNRERTWRFKWGQIDVSYEPRSFDAAIFMVPR